MSAPIGLPDACDDYCCEDYLCHEGHELPQRRRHETWDCPELSTAEQIDEIGHHERWRKLVRGRGMSDQWFGPSAKQSRGAA